MKIAKKNFLDLTLPYCDFKNSKIAIIPFGLESSVSYGQGTSNGPQAIIKASHEVELFDEELKKEAYKKKSIVTLEKFFINRNVSQALKRLEEIVTEIFEAKKMPIILGGEHTLTKAPLNFFKNKFKDLTILQFDAHADLRDSLDGDKDSHATVMRRCLELSTKINLVQIGIRNISNNQTDGREYDFLLKNKKRIKTFWAKDRKKWQMEDIIKNCYHNVYLSFDVDVFDPSIMPSTGTPEPGGLDWYQVIDTLKVISQKKNVVGADFVELAPIKNLHAPDFMIAKLIYKFIGYLK